MRYLLVGNGPSGDVGIKAKHADAVIQINECIHSELIPMGRTTHVFIVNSGLVTCPKAVAGLMKKKDMFSGVHLVLSRNPLFYRAKYALAVLRNAWTAKDLLLSDAWTKLGWPTESVSFLSTLKIEYRLWKLGMPPSSLPSTGMLAYHWLFQRMKPGDSLDITGFSFEGWNGHPWAIEKTMIKSIHYPGYRDDPSYEKRPV